ncbi:MAG: hypothetical protein KA299_09885 [Fusobacteriaceae bacterium]|nr:hypothetical protein [Fusobacteriaceae bacterium]
MLLSTLEIIDNLITTEVFLNKDESSKFILLLKDYKSNEYIYPEIFKSALHINSSLCYKIFSKIIQLGYIKIVYKLYCPKCHEVTDEIYESLNDINTDIFCTNCDYNLVNSENPFKYLVIFYKVVQE